MSKRQPDTAQILLSHHRLMGALNVLHKHLIEIRHINLTTAHPVIEITDNHNSSKLWGAEKVGICNDGLNKFIRKQVFINGCTVQWSEHA
jgi:hypothetical protein